MKYLKLLHYHVPDKVIRRRHTQNLEVGGWLIAGGQVNVSNHDCRIEIMLVRFIKSARSFYFPFIDPVSETSTPIIFCIYWRNRHISRCYDVGFSNIRNSLGLLQCTCNIGDSDRGRSEYLDWKICWIRVTSLRRANEVTEGIVSAYRNIIAADILADGCWWAPPCWKQHLYMTKTKLSINNWWSL